MIDVMAAMTGPSAEQEDYAKKEMSGHSDMMCQVFMQLGKLEAKIDMLMASEKEDEKEKETEPESRDGMLTLPMGSNLAGAMLDSSYNSSTSTYDGLPKTGTYNGSML